MPICKKRQYAHKSLSSCHEYLSPTCQIKKSIIFITSIEITINIIMPLVVVIMKFDFRDHNFETLNKLLKIWHWPYWLQCWETNEIQKHHKTQLFYNTCEPILRLWMHTCWANLVWTTFNLVIVICHTKVEVMHYARNGLYSMIGFPLISQSKERSLFCIGL